MTLTPCRPPRLPRQPSNYAPHAAPATHAPPSASQATYTFLRRLAGQSVNKAGLAKDQSEVNRRIYEASKGTKFYEREREKDLKLGEKIERLIRRVRPCLSPQGDRRCCQVGSG